MALRAHNGPAPSTRSAKAGDRVEFRAKVENTAAASESVALFVEDLKETFVFEFDPPAHGVPPKARKALTWTWTAALPEGKPALTFRGKLVLRRTTDGALIHDEPLDLYVGG